MASMFEAVAPSRPDDLAVAAQLNLGFRLYFAAVVWGRPQAAPITRARYGASRRPLTVIITLARHAGFPRGEEGRGAPRNIEFSISIFEAPRPGGEKAMKCRGIKEKCGVFDHFERRSVHPR